MLNLMQNYGIFTKVTVLKESIANEEKKSKKMCLNDKDRKQSMCGTSMYIAT